MTAKEKASRGESFRGAKQTIGDLPGVEGVHAPIINMALVSSNSVRKLVNQRFDDDRYIPYNGEIIVVQLLKTLLVPCLHSPLSAICRLVSLAAIITTQLYCHPKYSQLRPYLTSTGWLLDKPADLERKNTSRTCATHFPNPVAFWWALKSRRVEKQETKLGASCTGSGDIDNDYSRAYIGWIELKFCS